MQKALRGAPSFTPSPGYDCVMVTLSTAASTNEAPDASAASMRMRMDWPAYGLRLADAVAHTASRSAAAPVRVKTAVVPPLWTMLTRRKSADDALLPWARYCDRL